MESIEYTSLLGYLEEFNEGKIEVDELKEVFNEKYPGLFSQCVLGVSNDLIRVVESTESTNKEEKKAVTFPKTEFYEKVTCKDDMMKVLEFSHKVLKKTSSHEYWAFLNALYDYGTGKITIVDLKSKIAHDFEAFKTDFDSVLDFYTNLNPPSSSSDFIHNKEKKLNQVKGSYGTKRPYDEIEIDNKGKKAKRKVAKIKGKLPLSSSETDNKGKKVKEKIENVTVSYYVLPEHLSGKWNDEIGKQVLNDYCFSKGSTSGGLGKREQATEEEMERKAKEDEENRKEDVLFETDMRKAWMRSCKKKAMKLSEAIKGGGIEEGKMEGIVKEHLTGNDFAYIERMYEEYGSRIVDLLRHSPSLALPFIINRLTEQDTSPSCSPCDHLNLEYFNWHD
ncbi:hypothetical protein V6N13_126195 [Hibiscus sabdariffa]|uniref:Uncharacterized protein n=2 Tax=Hibiscus sabdariffa TaxID=183260 RepID=A0ABR2AE98_9ROSI